MDGRTKKFILELQKKPRIRRESGLYVIDGPKMAGEVDPEEAEEIYVTREFLASPQAESVPLLKEGRCALVTEQEMKQISDTVTPQGILILARQRRLKGMQALLDAAGDTAPLLLILERLQDPGNLGTILRAAEAAGVTGVLMDRETVDVYSPKVVRSTMGALLRVPFLTVEDLPAAVTAIRSGIYTGSGRVQVLAAHLEGAEDYTSMDYRQPTAVLIGNESRGLSEEITGLCDRAILIPMCGKTESLNAAMAAAVISFEAARQRRKNS